MRKITKLTETKYKTVREKDTAGNRIPKQVAYTAYREVNVVFGGKRFAHAFVDGIVYYVIYYFIEYFWIAFTTTKTDSLHAIISGFFMSMLFMFAFPIYYILFEHFLQKTPGKFLTKCIVIDIYGIKPDIGTNILRNIIRLVPFEIFSCLFSNRGWHDRWSETFVVSDEEYLKIKELQLSQTNSDVTEVSEPIKLPVTKRLKHIFLYFILPVSFILYIGILFKSCTDVKDVFDNPDLLKDLTKRNKINSETIELDNIAEIYNNGHVDEAQTKLLAFTKIHKDYHLAWAILGHTYIDQDNNEKAIEAYKHGVRVNKNAYESHNGLGMAYAAMNEFDKAKYEYRIADSLNQNNPVVIGNMANLYDEIGDIKKAITYGEKSVRLDSTNGTLCANLSIYYHNNKQYRKSDLMYMKAKKNGYESMEQLSDIVYPLNELEGFIQVSGNISNSNTDSTIKRAMIDVFTKDSIFIRQIYTNQKGKYRFVLPLSIQDIYLVKVSYPEYIHKYFIVNTEKVPIKGWETKIVKIEADITLSEKINGVDYSFLDKPLNYYFFNTNKNTFDFDKTLIETSIRKLKELKIIEQKIKQKKL